MQIFKKILVGILTLESRLIIAKYKPFIVAVTGSVGKTTTKDAIYTVLKDQSKFVRKSEKSMNSEIGLPLTIIGMPNAWHSPKGWARNVWSGFLLIARKTAYPDCLILEIGADHPGDIRKVVKWLHPNIAVITKVSKTPVHVEFFKSPEEVFEEKALLVNSMKTGGTVVLFADDEKVMTLVERVKNNKVNVLTYGTSTSATVKGTDEKIIYDKESSIVNDTDSKLSTRRPLGFSFNLNIDGKVLPINVRDVVGRVYMYPLLAAAVVGKVCSVSSEVTVKLLSDFEAPKGRMNLLQGINDSTIIDDTYNSSPDAALAALQTLKELETLGLKIAILGDMMELGKYAGEEHRKIGKELVGIVSELVTVGRRSQLTADEAIVNGFSKDLIHSFDTSSEAAIFISTRVNAGDIVLVKGSQSMRMERVVKALLKEPEKADRLLVRQEKEWLEKK